MGISLQDRRKNKRRRSYADYRPSPSNRGPGNRPGRVFLYILLIGALVWIFFNQALFTDLAKRLLFPEPLDDTAELNPDDADITPTPEAEGTIEAEDTASVDELLASAETAYNHGRLDEAVEYYRQAIEENPQEAAYHVEIARLLLFQSALQFGEEQDSTIEAALEAANMATIVDPYDPAGYAITGKIYDWQGDPERANLWLLQALELDPEYAPAYSYLAEAYVDQDKWELAQETIQTALNMQPNHPDIRRDHGYILEYLGYYGDAATQYETALSIQPQLPYVMVSLGRVYAVLGRYDDALEQFFDVQELEPANPVVLFEIGRTYESFIGDHTTALDYYQRAIDMDENYGRPWLRIGTNYYYQGRYVEAINALERALELDTVHRDIYYQLGLSYAYSGHCGNAMQYLNEAQVEAGDDERILDYVQEGYELCSDSNE